MRKLISSIVDATLNRVISFFANVFLRRLSAHVAASDALDIASIEEQIEQLQEQGRPAAASHLAAYLEEFRGEDPTYSVSTSFGRQLLADDYDLDTPQLRGEPVDSEEPPARRGRRRTTTAGRLARGEK